MFAALAMSRIRQATVWVLLSLLSCAATATEPSAAATAVELTPAPAAATPPAKPTVPDPFEKYNRKVYAFNAALDKAVVKPLANVYVAVIPRPIRIGVGNLVGHLAYPNTILNNLLQGKLADGGRDVLRFTLNSVVGMGGLLDPATEFGLLKNDEDFGQTLGKWGVASGPYLMLPFLGTSTLRDAPTLWVDYHTDLSIYLNDQEARRALMALHVVDTRVSIAPADVALSQAFDRYAFVRDAYLQRREYKVHDGNVPNQEAEPLEDPAVSP
jgi:phospholipid-binding lipoprotein MlaA